MVQCCLKQQGLAGFLRTASANDGAEQGWEGKESVEEEFTS